MRLTRALKWALPPLVIVGLVGALTAWQWDLVQDIPIGNGYAAHEICTRALHSGGDFTHVKEVITAPKVAPLPLFWNVRQSAPDAVEVGVYLPIPGATRTALYREGIGCTVVPRKMSLDDVRAQPLPTALAANDSTEPWPVGEGAVEGHRLDGELRDLLNGQAMRMFTEISGSAAARQNTYAYLVAIDGQLIYERYAENMERDTPHLGWSMTKTLTSLLAGTLAQDGLLDLDQPVGLRQWTNSNKAAITWRHLLNMAPGLEWDETYTGLSDVTGMLYSQGAQGAWAADRPLSSRPGHTFTYSTGFSNIAMLAMRELLGGGPETLHEHYQQHLFAPLGIYGGVVEPDASGTPVGGARGVLRPVDWLRLGQLILNEGSWHTGQIVPAEFIEFMLTPSPASDEYGGSLWRKPALDVSSDLYERLPDDMVYLQGHMGQFVVVVPSVNLVINRMGVTFDDDHTREVVFTAVAELVEYLRGQAVPDAESQAS